MKATGFAWILVAAAVPIQRWLTPELADFVDKAILGLLAISLLFRLVSRATLNWLWVSAIVVIPIAAYISGRSSSVTASLNVGTQLALLLAIAPFALAFQIKENPNFLRRIVGTFLTVQTISALVGIVQLSGVQLLGASSIFGRSIGLSGHPNVLGFMAAIAMTLCLGILVSGTAKMRTLIVAVFCLNAVALVATGSLSAMLAAFVALAVVVIASRKAIIILVIAVIGIAVLAALLVLAGFDPALLTSVVEYRVGVVTGTGASDGGAASLDTRELTYTWAWNYLSNSPFIGVGLDPMFSGTYDGVTVVHNFLLRAWYQGGMLFAAWLLVLALALIVGIVISSVVKGKNAVQAAVIMGILTFAWTSAFYNQTQYWLPLLLAVAMIPLAPRRAARSAD